MYLQNLTEKNIYFLTKKQEFIKKLASYNCKNFSPHLGLRGCK